MALSVGDMLRIKTTMEFGGKNCLNIFHVKLSGVGGVSYQTELAFAIGWSVNIMNEIMNILTSNTTLKEVYVENLTEAGRPFAIHPTNVVGSQAADAYASYGAVAVRQSVTTRKTRNGYKRFVGVPESNVLNGVFASSYVTLGQTMSTNVLGGGLKVLYYETADTNEVATYSNVILKSVHSEPPVDADWQYVSAANFIDRPTTQNTRKILGS